VDTLRQDLAYSLRSLFRARGFTAVIVVTLALGIGANSAIFSVVDAVLLRPLPFPDAGRVVHLKWDGSGHREFMSAAKFQHWHDHARSFDAMTTWRHTLMGLGGAGETSAVRALGVTPDFFRVLGYRPALGRGFGPADYTDGGPKVAIVSDAMWQTRFGSAADIVGRSVRLDGESVEVIGVLPASFAFPYEDAPVEMILPFAPTVDPNDVAEDWPAIARLREGVTRQQAQAEVASLMAPFRAAYPNQVSEQDRGMTLATFSELYVDDRVRRALWILMGAVAFVLLIACANVANLFLARAERRSREIAVRAAVGASRGRITRLVLTESALIAAAAGTLGLLVGGWVARALVALAPVEMPRVTEVGIDWRLAVFTFAASLGTSLLFGGAAARPALRARLSGMLNQGARASFGRNRTRQGLLVAQSALSMLLLVGAGLLVATFIGLIRSDPGFDPEGLVAVRLPSKPAGYETSQDLWALERRVVEQFEGSSLVSSIAGASSLPFERGINTPMSVDGRQDLTGTVEWRAVSPGYFRTLGVPLVAGRGLDDTDSAGGPPVAIVNQAFARRYFADGSPIGRRIEIGRSPRGYIDPSRAGPAVEIVGVVADIRDLSLRLEPRRTLYVPQAQASSVLSNVMKTMPVFIARPRLAGGDVGPAIRQALLAADPALPRPDVFPLDEVVSRSLARERFGATLLSVLAALALALTALGIYGALAYSVEQRRREIGIRMAVGADGRRVRRLVVGQAIAPVLLGLVLGVAGAVGLSRAMAGFLWGVTPTDPVTLGLAALLLLGLALAASWIPAREAANLDPLTALNCE
jgi:predicted permease